MAFSCHEKTIGIIESNNICLEQFCDFKISHEENKLLGFIQYQKSIRTPIFLYADTKPLFD